MPEVSYLIVKNPDDLGRRRIAKAIVSNGGYCLSQKKSPDTKCHCKHFLKTGECLCGLFISVPVVEVTDAKV